MIKPLSMSAAVGLFAGLVTLAACSGFRTSPSGPFERPAAQPAPASPMRLQTRPRLTLPPEVLYAIGGNPQKNTNYIMALNAQDTSPSPSPLYTIPPNGQGEYVYLAVDSSNYLFAIKYFPYSAKLAMFAPGSTKASVTCLFSTTPTGMYVANGLLYVAQADDTIVQYAEPLSASRGCSQPIKTLTDQLARRSGSKSLYGLMGDPFGNIFDVWQSSGNEQLYMDEFNAGSNHAHSFFALHDSYETGLLTSDHNGNIITNLENYQGSPNDAIAVMLHGTKTPQLFYPVGDGGYGGFALGRRDGELFAFRSYPTGEIHVYGYNAKSGTLGSERRVFSGIDGGSIAVFSK